MSARATRFVADFIGQKNLLDGTLLRVDGEFAEVQIPGGSIVRGRLPPGEAPAGAVTVTVRPERVALGSDFPAGVPSGWNAQNGTVADVIYLGTHTQVMVALPGGNAVTVHRQNRTGGDGGPQPGENVEVAFDPVSATILAG